MSKSFELFIQLSNLAPKNNYILFIILLFLITIPQQNCSCTSSSLIKDGDGCFNEIIRIDGRAGQFSLRNDNVLLIEYSMGGKRVFYGLKPNGRGLFENDASIFEIAQITKSFNSEGEGIDSRHESKNTLVSLIGENASEKQYIFSVSTYFALTELHYFDEDNKNSHTTWVSTDFFNISESRYIFSYQFSLIEGDSNTYYAAYIQYYATRTENGEEKAYGNSYTLSKFSFINATEREILTEEFPDNFENRIVCAFIFKHFNYLAVFFLKSNPLTYTMRLHNLTTLKQEHEKEFYTVPSWEKGHPGEGLFFKALYLTYEYFAFIFFQDDGTEKLRLRIYYVDKGNSYNLVRRNKHDFGYTLDISIRLNEFYKIDNERLLFITSASKTQLFIMFIDTYNWYYFINIRTYKFYMQDYYLREEIAVDFYNDFLMLTASVSKNGQTTLSSFLLFFSYPNGTDFYMNISPYVKNSEYYDNRNLISYLLMLLLIK